MLFTHDFEGGAYEGRMRGACRGAGKEERQRFQVALCLLRAVASAEHKCVSEVRVRPVRTASRPGHVIDLHWFSIGFHIAYSI